MLADAASILCHWLRLNDSLDLFLLFINHLVVLASWAYSQILRISAWWPVDILRNVQGGLAGERCSHMRDSSRITIHWRKLLWNFICGLVKERNVGRAVFSLLLVFIVNVLAFLTQGSLSFKVGLCLTLRGHELELINAALSRIIVFLELLKADNLVIFFFIYGLFFAFLLDFIIWIVRNWVFGAFSLWLTSLVWWHRWVGFNWTLLSLDLLSADIPRSDLADHFLASLFLVWTANILKADGWHFLVVISGSDITFWRDVEFHVLSDAEILAFLVIRLRKHMLELMLLSHDRLVSICTAI